MICLFCLRDGMDVRIDRKGRPYLACTSCSAKAFTRGTEAIALYSAVAEALTRVNLDGIRSVAMARLPDMLRRFAEVQNGNRPVNVEVVNGTR